MKKLLVFISLFISLAAYSQIDQQFGAVADNLDSLHTHVGRNHQYVVVLNVQDSTGGFYYYDDTSLATEVTNKVFKVTGKDTGRWFFVEYFDAGGGITALTGDVTASGTGSVAATLATVNSNVGSFTNASVTVNAKGLVTAVSSGTGGGATVYDSTITATAAQTAFNFSTIATPTATKNVFLSIDGVDLNTTFWSRSSTTYTITDGLQAGQLVRLRIVQ